MRALSVLASLTGIVSGLVAIAVNLRRWRGGAAAETHTQRSTRRRVNAVVLVLLGAAVLAVLVVLLPGIVALF